MSDGAAHDELLTLGLLIERRLCTPNATLGLRPEMFADSATRDTAGLVLRNAAITLGSPPWTDEVARCVGAALTSIERDRIDRPEAVAALRRVRASALALNDASGAEHSLNLVTAADLQSEPVEWLWNGCLAAGKLTVLEGDPGVSKTTLAIAVAAALSMGTPMPGGPTVAASDVLMATYEDGLADTIRPRLEAAGANLERVHLIDGLGEQKDLFTIPAHLPQLAARIQEIGARCVIIDPLAAALSGAVDTYKDHDIRRALAPLARLAEETGAAILVLRHLVKAGGARAIVAGGGSIAITAAARIVLRIDEDPSDPDRRILSVVKCNLTERAPSRVFRIDERLVLGAGLHPVIRWTGESPLSANDLAAARDRFDARESATRVDDGMSFLSEWLTNGPVSWREIDKLAKAQDISPGTLNRAADRLGVQKRRSGQGREHTSVWALPTPITSITADSTLKAGVSDVSALPVWQDPGDPTLETSPRQPPTLNGCATRRPAIVETLL